MRKKYLAGILILGVLSVTSGCGGGNVTYTDGTYKGQSEVYTNDDGTEDGNGYAVATITIKDSRIVECTFQTFEQDGALKDEDYGKTGGQVTNRDYYNKAQKAVAACEAYAELLSQNGSLDGIDAISGATINYDQFLEAAIRALDQAKDDK